MDCRKALDIIKELIWHHQHEPSSEIRGAFRHIIACPEIECSELWKDVFNAGKPAPDTDELPFAY